MKRTQSGKKLHLERPPIVMNEDHISISTHHSKGFRTHWHTFFEIEIVTSGKGIHNLNGQQFEIKKGSIYLLGPTDFHGFYAPSSISMINISFDEEMLTDDILSFLISSSPKKSYDLESGDYNRIIMAAKLLQHECEVGGSCKKQLCQYILSFFTRNMNIENMDYVNHIQLSGIRKSILYLEMHFREKLTLEALAKHAGFNPTYFSELFKKVTGETYVERLNTLRTGYAAMLLANGFSVSDSCYMSGFGSLSNFLSVFKAKFGVTPSSYRTEQIKKQS
ncbi:MAG: AraC family transcriptional regulator [Clostridia bacterium]|nr:AraC family transcriptional regulator [Clostridia bacterium]